MMILKKSHNHYLVIITLFMFFPLAGVNLYWSNNGNKTVDVIDTTNNAIIATIAISHPPGTSPLGIAASPANTTDTVSLGASSNIINVFDNTLPIPAVSNTFAIGINTDIVAVAYTPDGDSIYVSSQVPSTVIIPINNITAGSPAVGTPIALPQLASDIKIVNTTAYLAVNDTSTIYYIDTTNNTLHVLGIASGVNTFECLAVSPDNSTVYIIGGDLSGVAHVFSIDTASNTLNNSGNPIAVIPPGGVYVENSSGAVVSPDGTNLYIAENFNQQVSIVSIPGHVVTNFSVSGRPVALAITPDSSTLYVAFVNGTLASYSVPSGTATGFTLSPGGSNEINALAIAPIPSVRSLFPPATVSGCKTQNVFLLQTDFINNITWTAPASGTAPVAYKIYRDAYLTQLVATVPASGPLQYYDHDRNPGIVYSYYITSVDGSGNASTANGVTVTNPC